MVAPTGPQETQQLVLIDKNADGIVSTKNILRVRFSLLGDTEPRG